jgi:hypothetical protein
VSSDVPILFCIPLIGQRAAKDWRRVCKLLEQTLASILVQPGNIFVLIACNEIPQTRFNGNPRVRYLQLEGDVPKTIDEMRRDRTKKRNRLSDEVAHLGGGYAVRMDADDLVSNRLTRYIMEDNNRNGYYFKTGYTYNAKNGALKLSKAFNKLCGTCGVIYISPDELEKGKGALKVLQGGHVTFAERAEQIGKPLSPVPFPAAVYVNNTGESIRDRIGITSLAHGTRRAIRAIRWRLVKLLGRDTDLRALHAEFGIAEKT